MFYGVSNSPILKEKNSDSKIFMYEHCDMVGAMGVGWKGIVNRMLYRKCFSMAQGGIAISKYVKGTALQLTPGRTARLKLSITESIWTNFSISNAKERII